MKTTVELPDLLFRRAKAAAAEEGKSLKDFLAEAVSLRLRERTPTVGAPRWESAFGGLKDLRRETRKIERVIQETFESIDPEEWR
jgi:hypothetical protein